MLKHNISSAEDFAKLAEETERLAQHVEDVRQRMAAAAKRRQSRPDIQVVPAEPAHTSSRPEGSSAPREAEHRPSSIPPAASSSPSSSPPPAGKQPDSGVFPVMRDRDRDRDRDAGRYCFLADRTASLDPLLPTVARRPAKGKLSA